MARLGAERCWRANDPGTPARPRWNTGVLRSIRQNDEQDLARVVELVMLKSEHLRGAAARSGRQARARPMAEGSISRRKKNLHVVSCTGFSPNIHRFSQFSLVVVAESWFLFTPRGRKLPLKLNENPMGGRRRHLPADDVRGLMWPMMRRCCAFLRDGIRWSKTSWSAVTGGFFAADGEHHQSAAAARQHSADRVDWDGPTATLITRAACHAATQAESDYAALSNAVAVLTTWRSRPTQPGGSPWSRRRGRCSPNGRTTISTTGLRKSGRC